MPGGSVAEWATNGTTERTIAAIVMAAKTARRRPATSGNGAPSCPSDTVSVPSDGGNAGPESRRCEGEHKAGLGSPAGVFGSTARPASRVVAAPGV